jgi:predicted DNA-binding transcriptional regulator AlpA
MSDTARPLYALTVEEYREMNKELISEILAEMTSNRESIITNAESHEDIIFIDEAVILTGYKKSTIYTKVCRYEMPVVSRRRPLTFSRSEILKWMEDGKPSLIDNESAEYLKR